MPDAPTSIAIAIVEWNDMFLVGVRSAEKTLAGYAEFPGGRVEANETPEKAAVRECFEETGLTVAVINRVDERLHEYAHGHMHLHFFACALNTEDKTPSKPFRWVSRSELETLNFPEANREVVQVLSNRSGTTG
jgi:8-oxo-dGTP diphosphatase